MHRNLFFIRLRYQSIWEQGFDELWPTYSCAAKFYSNVKSIDHFINVLLSVMRATRILLLISVSNCVYEDTGGADLYIFVFFLIERAYVSELLYYNYYISLVYKKKTTANYNTKNKKKNP